MAADTDHEVLRQAAAAMHQLALWLDLQAERRELGKDDDETRAAVAFARKVTGRDEDDEESPCG